MFNFCEVFLVAPWSLTLAGIILAGANSKLNDYEQSTKNEKPSENEFHGKTVLRFRTKKEQKHYSRPFKKPQWDTRTLKLSIEYRPEQ